MCCWRLEVTEELFREDATLLNCTATVLARHAAGLVLDRTVFYPLGLSLIHISEPTRPY